MSTGRIDGLLSQVTVRQTFVNATGEPLEATYIFPLPDRAAVTDFRMEVAGRVVEGVLKERGQARREYSQAVRQGHRASIAEEERPGVFSLRVGNLMPGDVATVAAHAWWASCRISDGEVTFRFPLVVAPRYIPGVPLCGPSVGEGTAVDTNAVPDASRISPPVLLPGFPNPVRLSLTIDLYEPADDLRVSLFTVWGKSRGRAPTDPSAGRAVGPRFHPPIPARRRCRADVAVAPSRRGREWRGDLCADDRAAGFVRRRAASSGPETWCFLLDRSGSMERLEDGGGPPGDGPHDRHPGRRRPVRRFRLRRSDRDAASRPKKDSRSIPATDRNRFKAVEFLAKLESRGGTEIAQPLDQAVELLRRAVAMTATASSCWSPMDKSAMKTRCSKCSVRA